MTPVDEIRKTLAEDLRIGELSHEEQNEVFSKLRSIILEKIELAIWTMLSLEQRTEFESLVAAGKLDQIRVYAQEKIPNLPFVIEAVALDTIRKIKEEAS